VEVPVETAAPVAEEVPAEIQEEVKKLANNPFAHLNPSTEEEPVREEIQVDENQQNAFTQDQE